MTFTQINLIRTHYSTNGVLLFPIRFKRSNSWTETDELAAGCYPYHCVYRNAHIHKTCYLPPAAAEEKVGSKLPRLLVEPELDIERMRGALVAIAQTQARDPLGILIVILLPQLEGEVCKPKARICAGW